MFVCCCIILARKHLDRASVTAELKHHYRITSQNREEDMSTSTITKGAATTER